jgi:hypothetical protein
MNTRVLLIILAAMLLLGVGIFRVARSTMHTVHAQSSAIENSINGLAGDN